MPSMHPAPLGQTQIDDPEGVVHPASQDLHTSLEVPPLSSPKVFEGQGRQAPPSGLPYVPARQGSHVPLANDDFPSSQATQSSAVVAPSFCPSVPTGQSEHCENSSPDQVPAMSEMGEARSEATSGRLIVIVLSSIRSSIRSSRPSLLAPPHLWNRSRKSQKLFPKKGYPVQGCISKTRNP